MNTYGAIFSGKYNGLFKQAFFSIFIAGGIIAVVLNFVLERSTVVNKPPKAIITLNVSSGEVPLNVLFDAVSSSDPENEALSYHWRINGKSISTEVFFSYTFHHVGTTRVKLSVRDQAGLSASASAHVTAHSPKKVTTLKDALKYRSYMLGWSRPNSKHVRYLRIKQVQLQSKDNAAYLKYDCQDGEIYTVLLEENRKLLGVWKDHAGAGEFELVFTQDYRRASGWWKYAHAKKKYAFSLKQILRSQGGAHE